MYTDPTFCSLRVSSARIDQREICLQIERMNCNDQSSGIPTHTDSRLITSWIHCNNPDTCNSVINFLQTCPNTAQMRSEVDFMECSTSWYRLCPNTTSEPPISNNYPTSPTNGSTSSMSTLSTESLTKASSQISKLTDERDTLMVAVVSLGALVGILVILLAVVTTGWVWTCWTMKRNKATTSSEHVRYSPKR